MYRAILLNDPHAAVDRSRVEYEAGTARDAFNLAMTEAMTRWGDRVTLGGDPNAYPYQNDILRDGDLVGWVEAL